MYQQNINQYHCRELRDLEWVLNSPALLSETSGLPLASMSVLSGRWLGLWLASLDANPKPLLDYLEGCSCVRLGSYFEALLGFALEQAPGLSLLLNQWVVRDGGHTLGECDFIFRDDVGKVFHWEVSVKFYLYFRGHCLGANPRDRLDRKCQHLRERQLLLPQQPLVKQRLRREFAIEQLSSQVYMKGMLFYPLGHSRMAMTGVSSHHLRGDWCHLSQLVYWLADHPSVCRYRVLPRLQWLAADFLTDGDHLLASTELVEQLNSHFSAHYQAQMVVMLDEIEGGWYERRRCVVVAESWPEQGLGGVPKP